MFFSLYAAGVMPGLICLPICVMIAIAAMAFASLTVEIDGNVLKAWFNFGWPRKQIKVDQIAKVEVVRNGIMEGFGVRYTAQGWMWNVSGLDAVRLTYTDGTVFRIGTDESDRLAGAINDARGEG